MSAVFIPWTFLETKHISDYLIHDQLTLVNRAREKGDPKHIEAILDDTCAYIQNRIPQKFHPNPMAHNHIPVACKTAACHLVIEALQSRLPDLKLSEDQIRNAQQARKTIDDLAAMWEKQSNPKITDPRIEAVYYRRRDARQSTLKGF